MSARVCVRVCELYRKPAVTEFGTWSLGMASGGTLSMKAIRERIVLLCATTTTVRCSGGVGSPSSSNKAIFYKEEP